MYQNFCKYPIPRPHKQEIIDTRPQIILPRKFSTSLSTKALNNIRTRALPSRETQFNSVTQIKQAPQKRTIILSNPNIKIIFKKLAQARNPCKPKGESSFFYANIILPKKKLPDLYSKGFYIGSEKYSEENSKHSASKSLSFINTYYKSH